MSGRRGNLEAVDDNIHSEQGNQYFQSKDGIIAMIRALRPTDVVALLLFLSRPPIEEARARDRLSYGGWQLPLLFHLLKCSIFPDDERRFSVSVERGLIHGLACLRSLSGPEAWEVKRLLLAPGHEGCCLNLLERIGLAVDKLGAERIFLRLDSGSPAVDMAKGAGFCRHLTEHLYRLGGRRRRGQPEPAIPLRRCFSEDDYRLFRLYSAAVPLQVRTVEGMTLQEWSRGRERGKVREWAYEDKGEIKAWLRVWSEGMTGQFDIVTSLGGDGLGSLVDCALSLLSGREPVYCVVPEYQQGLMALLEERGFRWEAEYTCLNRQLAARIREPQLVPLQA